MTDHPDIQRDHEARAESILDYRQRVLERAGIRCPEAAKREAMGDSEFWDYVLNGIEPGTLPADGDDDYFWEPEWDEPTSACPECGVIGACGYDQEGRPLIHSTWTLGRTL